MLIVQNKKTFRNGFTLVELIIVISIIAVLSTIGISTYSSIQQNSRNAKRKADLKEIKTALEQYFSVNGAYPTSAGNWRGTCSDFGSYGDTGATGYIPGIAPAYMAKLPRDPRESKVNTSSASSSCATTAASNCYLYRSNGTDYKILAHCSPEGTMSSNDSFYDPLRSVWAWQVSSSANAYNNY